ncbi:MULTISPECIES: thioredoxin family protein [unclassified Frankia]|uniref:thioredoxin family protein n=1 Tax=unclassified Frankia TaxID=2632575 RepID=UPI0020259928
MDALLPGVTGLWVLVAAVGCAVGLAVLVRLRDGRFRVVRPGPSAPAAPVVPDGAVADAIATAAAQPVGGDVSGGGDVSDGENNDGENKVTDGDEAPAAPHGPARPEDAGPEDAGPDGIRPDEAGSLAAVDAELVALGVAPGARATLVQFSTAFCAPCRATRRILADVASGVPGVRHVEVDAESHLELVRRLRIRRTPTVLVLDARAREVCRASGAPPGRAAVLAALELAVGEPRGRDPAAAADNTMIDVSDRPDWPSDR